MNDYANCKLASDIGTTCFKCEDTAIMKKDKTKCILKLSESG